LQITRHKKQVNNPRIEDYVIFHDAECGGALTGELGGEMCCGECAAIMSAFVSDADEVHLRKPKPRSVAARRLNTGKFIYAAKL
jgi:hypothetical protein